MFKELRYRDFIALVSINADDRCFVGTIKSTDGSSLLDIITFHGETFDEFEHNFKEAVDCYLESFAYEL